MRFLNKLWRRDSTFSISLLAKTHSRAIYKGCICDVLSSVHDELSARLGY